MNLEPGQLILISGMPFLLTYHSETRRTSSIENVSGTIGVVVSTVDVSGQFMVKFITQYGNVRWIELEWVQTRV